MKTLTRNARTTGSNHRSTLAITQRFGTVKPIPNGLSESARLETAHALNQLLADTMVLRDLYKKHHWQVSGPTFYQLHLLFDKHYEQQSELVDTIAERIQQMGGVAIALAPDVAEHTRIPRAPRDRENVATQIKRLLQGHELVLKFAHEQAKKAGDRGDDGTNDMLAGTVIRTNEMQVWFVSEHLAAG